MSTSQELSSLYQTALDINSTLDLDTVLEAVIRRTSDLVQAQQGEVVLYDADSGLVTQFLNLGLEQVGIPVKLHEIGQAPDGLDGMVISTAKPIIVEAYDEWPQRLEDAPPGRVGSMIGIPLIHRERVLGSLSLARSPGQPPFTEEDQHQLELFANQSAVAIANAIQFKELQRLHAEEIEKQQLDQQLLMARAVQSGLLPDAVPQIAGWDIAVTWQPAFQISGDFYDFIPLDRTHTAIVVADVVDKGIPAALLMSMARSLFRVYATLERPPSRVLTRVNQNIAANSSTGLFVTAFYGILDTQTRTLSYSNAGHIPPALLHADSGLVESTILAGLPLGVEADSKYQDAALVLKGNDQVVLYTDGVTEAMNGDNEEFGFSRLEAILKRATVGSAQDLIQGLNEAIHQFIGESSQSDDITIV